MFDAKLINSCSPDLNTWEFQFKTCYYSKRLLKELSSVNSTLNKEININKIKKAIFFCKKYHSFQMRQSGEPYYSHPLEVAGMVADHCFKTGTLVTTDLLVTSILHDTLEDTVLTKEMIAYIFDPKIADNVEDLTRIKDGQKISSLNMVKILIQQKKYDILLIKYFDRMHNMQTIKVKSVDKIKQITSETLEIFFNLGEKLNIEPEKQNLLMHLCGMKH